MKQLTLEKITHLIPLSEFINHVKQLEKPIDQPFEAFKLFQLGLIFRCTTFLEQSLELWQFVPVGDNNEVLEEPKESDFKDETGFVNNAYFIELSDYNKAKERCLFEGFEKRSFEYNPNSFQIVNPDCDIQSCIYKSNPDYYTWNYKKVEELSGLGIPLTQLALKQIY